MVTSGIVVFDQRSARFQLGCGLERAMIRYRAVKMDKY